MNTTDKIVYTVSDADIAAMQMGALDFDPEVTCRFHLQKGGVTCYQNRLKPGQCDKCGWNPRVAKRRSYLYRQKLREESEGTN